MGLHLRDRTRLDRAVADAGAPLRPGHCLFNAGNIDDEVAGKLFLGVRIGAVENVGLAVAYANAGCRRSRLEPHPGAAASLRERFIESSIVRPEALVRLGEGRIVVMDDDYVF